jgi:hypothetical protein
MVPIVSAQKLQQTIAKQSPRTLEAADERLAFSRQRTSKPDQSSGGQTKTE